MDREDIPEGLIVSCPEGKANYTYMLLCGDSSIYTGWTPDLSHRLKVHNQGLGGKYTRSRLPVRLVYYEISDTKQEAMSREWHIKRLNRQQKIRLIREKAGFGTEWSENR